MMILDNIDSIKVGNVSASVVLPKGSSLPSVGDILYEDGMELFVTDVDKESRTVHFINRSNLSKEDVIENFKSNFKAAVEEAAVEIFKWYNRDKMSQFIMWEDLPEKTKDPYRDLVVSIITILSARNITTLDPAEIINIV
jgi:hypothetical protein